MKVAQSCPTLCDPMDYTGHAFLQARPGVGSLSLLQGIFLNQGLNPGLPHCRWILYQLSHKGSHLHELWTSICSKWIRKGRGTRDEVANNHWISKKQESFRKKKSTSALLTMPKPLTVWITTNCGKKHFMRLRIRNLEGKKKKFVLFSSLTVPEPYFSLESPRHLSPPQGPKASHQPA